MSDLIEKIEYLALRMRVARDLVLTVGGTDHDKRLMGRAVFQLAYAFLALAPCLQNELWKAGTIKKVARDAIKVKIADLRTLFAQEQAPIRHSLTAHHQPLDLSETLEHWNAIDEKGVERAHAMVVEIAEDLLLHKGGIDWSKSASNEVLAFIKERGGESEAAGGVRFSTDAFAATRPNTTGVVPSHPDHEKAARVNGILLLLRRLAACVNAAARAKSDCHIVETIWALFILAGTSLIDNLYEDRTDDDSLIRRWTVADYKGLQILEAKKAARDVALEARISSVRNHFAAHLDESLSLNEILEEFGALDHVAVANYFFDHANSFRTACAADRLTDMFLSLDQKLKGFSELGNKFVAPFLKQGEATGAAAAMTAGSA